MSSPLIGIAMGSASDLDRLKAGLELIRKLEIPHEIRILSAHRTPAETAAWSSGARDRGLRVLIAAAGGAAHLAGAVAAHTTLPVIGIPLAVEPLQGFDALLSTVQMPPGVPVATVAAGSFGAVNAILLAAQILGIHDPDIRAKVDADRQLRAQKALQADRELSSGT